MKILTGLRALPEISPGAIVSIGNFDGIHRGHQTLLALGRELRQQETGSMLAVVTFEPHPLTVLNPKKAPPRLTPRDAKRDLLAANGVDALIELAPAPDVLDLSAEQFFAIMRNTMRPSHLIEGSRFYFGKGRSGNVDRLRQWCVGSGIQLHVITEIHAPLLDLRVAPISSTMVRWLVAYGRVRDAAICLGRPYALFGPVIKGFQRGRGLGVPTANLRCDDQLVPPDGVYAGRCSVGGQIFPAAVSIGAMPTYGEHDRQIEAHLIGFNGDLYGSMLEVQLLDWLREQRKYASLEALKRQIALDIVQTVDRATDDVTRSIGAA